MTPTMPPLLRFPNVPAAGLRTTDHDLASIAAFLRAAVCDGRGSLSREPERASAVTLALGGEGSRHADVVGGRRRSCDDLGLAVRHTAHLVPSRLVFVYTQRPVRTDKLADGSEYADRGWGPVPTSVTCPQQTMMSEPRPRFRPISEAGS